MIRAYSWSMDGRFDEPRIHRMTHLNVVWMSNGVQPGLGGFAYFVSLMIRRLYVYVMNMSIIHGLGLAHAALA
jgi:hypothetical protein